MSGGKGETAQQVKETADEPAVQRSATTAQKNVAVGMFAADCPPVPGGRSGSWRDRRALRPSWPGRTVIGATIEKMVSKGASTGCGIVATLGLCICGDCYEVGGDIETLNDAQF